jgi:hypothetical protein
VQAHGGRIWVDSAPGKGAAFHVALPLAPSEERPAASAQAGTPQAAPGGASVQAGARTR